MATALPAASADQAVNLLDEARKLKASDDYQGARERASAALNQATSDAVRNAARDLLGEVDIGLVLSERPMPEKIDYTIASGDTLAKLASRNGTTLELVSKGNNIKGPIIRIGDRMRIFTGKFSIKIDKSDNILDLQMNDTFFKRYKVGTGQYSKTPTGTFTITDRIAQPTWWRDDGKAIPYGDPENLLGTHWLSLDIRGYGIHGTWEPDTIGKQSSAGCIRLLNEDIQELFTLIPIGTPVTIED
ncbi:MAG: L,D-transpeptidase family protein [bacterium]